MMQIMTGAREHWGNRFGFIMATAGSAVGLGSLWKFPHTAGENGGGAFVILYLIFTFLIGLPVFLGELTIGRRTQKSAVLAYSNLTNHSTNWRMLGWLNIISCIIILSYYSVVSGWCLSYTLMSLTQYTKGKSIEAIQATFDTLYASPGLNVLWLFLFLLINVGIVYGGIRKGIEYWTKILMPALLLILIAMFIYCTTLSGFPKALDYIFVPHFEKLTTQAILNALGMAFFTLSVGLGILVTYGSYMQEGENIPYNGVLISLMTVFVSLIAALTIFPIVFSFNFPPEGGPGLVFKTLPVLFSQIPATVLISTIFFALLLFAALTSTVSLLEVLVANTMEVFDISRHKAVIICASITFVLAIPSALTGSKVLFPTWESIYGKSFFDTMNYITTSWFMPIGGLITTLFLGWRISSKETIKEFLQGTNKMRWLARPWFFMLRYIAPIAVFIILLQEAGILNLSLLFHSGN